MMIGGQPIRASAARLLTLGAILALAGCDRRDPALETITANAVKLRASAGTGDAPGKTYAQVAKDLSDVSKGGGRAGAAASLLIATSQLGIADAESSKYLEHETHALQFADQALAALSQWTSMHTLATGADAFSIAGELSRIASERTKAQESLAAAGSEKAKVEQEIARLKADAKSKLDASSVKMNSAAQITADTAKMSATQAADAASKAHEVRIEGEALRRAGLDLTGRAELLQPTLDEWSLKMGQHTRQLQILADSEQSLQEQERLAKQSAADARSDAGKAGERVVAMVHDLQELRAGAIEESAAKALATLKRASDAAKSAGKNDGSPGQSALALGMAQQAIAELRLARASGFSAYHRTLDRLAKATPALPTAADYASKVDGAHKAMKDEEAAAKAAFEEAKTAFDRASKQGSGPAKEQLARLSERLGSIAAKLSTEAQDATAPAPAPAAEEKPAPTAAAPSIDPKLKATLARYLEANKSRNVDALLAFMHTSNDDERMIVQDGGAMVKSLMKFDAALRTKFSKGLDHYGSAMPGADQLFTPLSKARGEFDKYQSVTIDDFKVTMKGEEAEVTSPAEDETLTFQKFDGRWMRVNKKMQADMANPAFQAQLKMMKMFIGPLGKAAEEIAAEVESGTHATGEAAMQAFMMKLAPLMQGMMGGG